MFRVATKCLPYSSLYLISIELKVRIRFAKLASVDSFRQRFSNFKIHNDFACLNYISKLLLVHYHFQMFHPKYRRLTTMLRWGSNLLSSSRAGSNKIHDVQTTVGARPIQYTRKKQRHNLNPPNDQKKQHCLLQLNRLFLFPRRKYWQSRRPGKIPRAPVYMYVTQGKTVGYIRTATPAFFHIPPHPHQPIPARVSRMQGAICVRGGGPAGPPRASHFRKLKFVCADTESSPPPPPIPCTGLLIGSILRRLGRCGAAAGRLALPARGWHWPLRGVAADFWWTRCLRACVQGVGGDFGVDECQERERERVKVLWAFMNLVRLFSLGWSCFAFRTSSAWCACFLCSVRFWKLSRWSLVREA